MSVAKPLPHDAAMLHVTGAARYVDDIPTPRGTLHLDEGAAQAVRSGKSLLPAGIARVEGEFSRGETVSLGGPDGVAIAKGITAYGAEELRRIAGLRSADIEAALGYRRGVAAIHAHDLVLEDHR